MRDVAADAQMVQIGRLCAQTGFDVTQASPVGQLGNGHAQKLVEATEGAHVEVASIPGYQAVKRMLRRKLDHLGEPKLSNMHDSPPVQSGNPALNCAHRSNRLHLEISRKPCQLSNLWDGIR